MLRRWDESAGSARSPVAIVLSARASSPERELADHGHPSAEYYRFWTPENWLWKGNTIEQFRAVVEDIEVARNGTSVESDRGGHARYG